tara:strand:- start:2665 stop:3081 length:417 start_codon:yes stop_codon:yes gene_type:complete
MNLRKNIKKQLRLLKETDDRPDNWRELPGYNPDAFYPITNYGDDEIVKDDDTSSRLPAHFYEDDYDLDEGDLDEIFDETQRGDRVRYFVDVYYDTMLPSSGNAEKDKVLAEKIARADLRSLKNREYIIGPVELRGYYN